MRNGELLLPVPLATHSCQFLAVASVPDEQLLDELLGVPWCEVRPRFASCLPI